MANPRRTSRLAADKPSRRPFWIKTSIGAGALLLVTGIGATLYLTGWLTRAEQRLTNATLSLTRRAHFAVRDVAVEGRNLTNRDQLMVALGTTRGDAIFGFDPEEAQARIATLPWVNHVTVERRLPDSILVHLDERVPMARWQHDAHIAVIDSEGHVLPDTDPASFANLPLVVGADAPAETKRLLDLLEKEPLVRQNIKAAVRASERRWDLYLAPNVVARLPEKTESTALKRLTQLITEQKILERDVVAIDLRFTDHLVLERGTPEPTRHAGDPAP